MGRDLDWKKVEALAFAIADAVGHGRSKEAVRLTRRMLALLSELERKHGKHPSILATRADYVDSSKARLRLFLDAYSRAKRRGDRRNLWLIACSLAEYYIEEDRNPREGRRWLKSMKAHLNLQPDRSGKRWARELERELARLIKRAGATSSSRADLPGVRTSSGMKSGKIGVTSVKL